ncbi:MAG: hypothetical protein HY586_02865, partial [Candidatus Omnitrophica bacterium]|nr:hypothetical protein [Candidatus Omnitrophota bacterium]
MRRIPTDSQSKRIFLRLIACCLASIFSIQILLWPVDASALLAPQIPSPPFAPTPPLQLASELGRISEYSAASFHTASSQRVRPHVYLIQDAHDSLDAQESIRSILRQLVKQAGVSRVLFEGGSGKLDRTFYARTQDEALNRKVWDKLFSAGEIGGLERFALEAPAAVQFSGIEHEPGYFENVRALLKTYEAQKDATSEIERIGKEFKRKATICLRGKARRIYQEGKKYRAGDISLAAYFSHMSRWAKDILLFDVSHPVNQFLWPALVRFAHLEELAKEISKDRSTLEAVLQKLGRRTPAGLKFIWNPSQHYLARGNLRWYFERALDQCPELLADFQKASAWAGYHILRDELKPEDLSKELELLEEKLYGALELSRETKRFLREEKEWELVLKLTRLALSRKERGEMQLRIKNEELRMKN